MLCCYKHVTHAIRPSDCKSLGLLFARFCSMTVVKTVIGRHTWHNPAGAVMEPNQFLDMAAFKKLEKMPTKIEMIATIARLLNQVRNIELACACMHGSMSSLHSMAYALYYRMWTLDLHRLLLNDCSCPCTMYGTGSRCRPHVWLTRQTALELLCMLLRYVWY